MILHGHGCNDQVTSLIVYANRDSLVTFTVEVISGH